MPSSLPRKQPGHGHVITNNFKELIELPIDTLSCWRILRNASISNTAGGTETIHVSFMKQAITIRIDPELLKVAKLSAEVENRTLTNFVETLIKAHVARSSSIGDAQGQRHCAQAVKAPQAKALSVNIEKRGHG